MASSNYPRLEPRRREASERNRSRWRLVRNIHRSALTLCGARASDGNISSSASSGRTSRAWLSWTTRRNAGTARASTSSAVPTETTSSRKCRKSSPIGYARPLKRRRILAGDGRARRDASPSELIARAQRARRHCPTVDNIASPGAGLRLHSVTERTYFVPLGKPSEGGAFSVSAAAAGRYCKSRTRPAIRHRRASGSRRISRCR